MHRIPVLDEIFDTLQTVCLGCDYYVTIECAQTICAPLLQNAQYATEVRRFFAHTRNRCVIKITKYPDVLAQQYWPLFYTYFAIDFSERVIPANIDRSILLTARMGRYGVKVALLRCLIRLIIQNIVESGIFPLEEKKRKEYWAHVMPWVLHIDMGIYTGRGGNVGFAIPLICLPPPPPPPDLELTDVVVYLLVLV